MSRDGTDTGALQGQYLMEQAIYTDRYIVMPMNDADLRY